MSNHYGEVLLIGGAAIAAVLVVRSMKSTPTGPTTSTAPNDAVSVSIVSNTVPWAVGQTPQFAVSLDNTNQTTTETVQLGGGIYNNGSLVVALGGMTSIMVGGDKGIAILTAAGPLPASVAGVVLTVEVTGGMAVATQQFTAASTSTTSTSTSTSTSTNSGTSTTSSSTTTLTLPVLGACSVLQPQIQQMYTQNLTAQSYWQNKLQTTTPGTFEYDNYESELEQLQEQQQSLEQWANLNQCSLS